MASLNENKINDYSKYKYNVLMYLNTRLPYDDAVLIKANLHELWDCSDRAARNYLTAKIHDNQDIPAKNLVIITKLLKRYIPDITVSDMINDHFFSKVLVMRPDGISLDKPVDLANQLGLTK